jgi:hypothetical protein
VTGEHLARSKPVEVDPAIPSLLAGRLWPVATCRQHSSLNSLVWWVEEQFLTSHQPRFEAHLHYSLEEAAKDT